VYNHHHLPSFCSTSNHHHLVDPFHCHPHQHVPASTTNPGRCGQRIAPRSFGTCTMWLLGWVVVV
jgi:hypothetical protein